MIPKINHEFEIKYDEAIVYSTIQCGRKALTGRIIELSSVNPGMSILGIMGISGYCTLLNDLRRANILKEFNWKKFSYVDEYSLESFIDLLKANVDNENLSDKEFRSFIKNSMSILEETMSKKGEK
ncbi:unnamed protein product [marine sediment metagenome]|uniref:Uncharacterized protein n=1 Tax=marine sediment metagenome TaxID=412755 RepID=X1A7D4_9ZZZZ